MRDLDACDYGDCSNSVRHEWYSLAIVLDEVADMGWHRREYQIDVQICRACAYGKDRRSVMGSAGWNKVMLLFEDGNRVTGERRPPPTTIDLCTLEFRSQTGLVVRHEAPMPTELARVF